MYALVPSTAAGYFVLARTPRPVGAYYLLPYLVYLINVCLIVPGISFEMSCENHNTSLASRPIHANGRPCSSSARCVRLLYSRSCAGYFVLARTPRLVDAYYILPYLVYLINVCLIVPGISFEMSYENHNTSLASRPIHANGRPCSSSSRCVRLLYSRSCAWH